MFKSKTTKRKLYYLLSDYSTCPRNRGRETRGASFEIVTWVTWLFKVIICQIRKSFTLHHDDRWVAGSTVAELFHNASKTTVIFSGFYCQTCTVFTNKIMHVHSKKKRFSILASQITLWSCQQILTLNECKAGTVQILSRRMVVMDSLLSDWFDCPNLFWLDISDVHNTRYP